MASHEELTGALLDVRKAYRLLYLFQRRILDLVEQLSGMLGRRFWCWLPAGMDEAIRGGASPSEKNAWKMLPLHNAEFFFLPPGAEPNASPREGQWLLELSVTPDGGYTDGGRAEANPIEFTDPADCQSTIYLCAFIVKKDMAINWWPLYQSSDWPKNEDGVAETVRDGVRAVGVAIDLAALHDRTALEALSKRFRELVEAEGGVVA